MTSPTQAVALRADARLCLHVPLVAEARTRAAPGAAEPAKTLLGLFQGVAGECSAIPPWSRPSFAVRLEERSA